MLINALSSDTSGGVLPYMGCIITGSACFTTLFFTTGPMFLYNTTFFCAISSKTIVLFSPTIVMCFLFSGKSHELNRNAVMPFLKFNFVYVVSYNPLRGRRKDMPHPSTLTGY